MACPIPPLAPRCVAARRKDVCLVLCALQGGMNVPALASSFTHDIDLRGH